MGGIPIARMNQSKRDLYMISNTTLANTREILSFITLMVHCLQMAGINVFLDGVGGLSQRVKTFDTQV